MASRSQQVVLYVFIALWVAFMARFWMWWLSSYHADIPVQFAINTALLAWTTILPSYYLYFLTKMKKVNLEIRIPSGLRVAMVVTKTPHEPFSVVRETLEAMLTQEYPHDTWLADEEPREEVLRWCGEHDVQVSSRFRVAEYHNPTWPRRTKCKEGNLAYFYDMYGYDQYDVVVQMDADHRPAAGYLEAMLHPFADPAVGYVSAPSICDANAKDSWTVRMRLYAEATLHGSLQAGYNDGWAPLCIGSHYAVRTKALREVGGLGPELAEDHSTTLLMNAFGWRGVHALDAEAHGDGPATFHDCIIQEYQWSKSLMVVLLKYFPKYGRQLSLKLKFQFLFSELWYPLFACSMVLAFLQPVAALVTRTPWAHVGYIDFLAHSVPPVALLMVVVWWVKRNGWLRPQNTPILRWEPVLFELARWPWVLLGIVGALWEVVRAKPVEFRITPKGEAVSRHIPFKTIVPYAFIAGISLLAVIGVQNAGGARGYYFLLLVNAFLYLLLLGAVLLKT